jgi:hypothetical protein
MAKQIWAQNGTADSYLIGEGPEPGDPMALCSVADVESGILSDPVPFQQHLKWGDFHPVPHDPVLLTRLLRVCKPRPPQPPEPNPILPGGGWDASQDT